jgi:hypothetical protein
MPAGREPEREPGDLQVAQAAGTDLWSGRSD